MRTVPNDNKKGKKNMSIAVIYTSETGATGHYAKMIAEKTGGDLYDLKTAKKTDLYRYDAIVYGGWLCVEGIRHISWFKKNMDQWSGKKLAVFCVGISSSDSPEIEGMFQRLFSEEEAKRVKNFYIQGGFEYDKKSIVSALVARTTIKAMKEKKNGAEKAEDFLTEEEEKISLLMEGNYDACDEKEIEAIVSYLKDGNG